jgi:hypothetical protein
MSETANAFVNSLRTELNSGAKNASLQTFGGMEGMRRSIWPGEHRSIVFLVAELAARAGLIVEIVERGSREYFRFTLPKTQGVSGVLD